MDVYPDISFVRGLLAAGFLLTSGAPIAATETGEWVLVREGKPVATIVTPDEPLAASHHEMGFIDATQVTAAEVLQTYLERVSGARLPIVSAAMAPETGPLIVVGRNGLTDAAGLFPPTEPEGFRVAAWSRGLAILGEIADAANPAHNTATDLDRGILHGVYAFLERDIGYRFYFANPDDPDLGMVIPRRPTVAIPLPLAYADAPVFSLRQHTSLGHLGASRGGASDRFHANHTHVGWRDRFRDSHPEFFALNADGTRNGRYLCYSEPGVLQAELAQLEQHYGGAREMAMVSRRFIPVLPDDNWRVCHCERCQAWHQGGPFWGRFSDLWFDYVRRLAAEVGRRWPETRVSTLAYRNQTQPPTLDLPDNVDVMVCLHPYGPAVPIGQLYMAKQPHIYAANLDLMLRWRGKLGDDPSRLSFWAYYICPDAHTGMPVLFPNVLQAWLRDVRPLCRGTFIDSGERNPETHLMLWLWMRMLWDTEIDIDAALEDHCRQF